MFLFSQQMVDRSNQRDSPPFYSKGSIFFFFFFDIFVFQEEEAFRWLVGNLLDEIHVTEARKVSSYFKKSTPDLDIVLVSDVKLFSHKHESRASILK